MQTDLAKSGTIHTNRPPCSSFGKRAGRSASRPTRSRLLCTRGINGSSSPLAGRESAECFVNSWSSAERRAEGANRALGRRSGAAALQDELPHRTESHSSTDECSSTSRRVVAPRRARIRNASGNIKFRRVSPFFDVEFNYDERM